MQVLVLGLPRTGTSSIRHALFTLGHFDVYHGVSVWSENPPDAQLWNKAFAAKFEDGHEFTKQDWDRLLGHCMAVTDHPCCIFAEELIAAYPDAKIILSVRDSAEVWRRSMESTVVQVARLQGRQSLYQRLRECFVQPHYLEIFGRNLIKYDRLLDVPWDYQRIYNGHEARIRKLVADHDGLLVYNVKDGWEPLCRFLGKDVPDQEFPRMNDRATFAKNLEPLMDQSHATTWWVTLPALVVTVVVAAGCWLRQR